MRIKKYISVIYDLIEPNIISFIMIGSPLFLIIYPLNEYRGFKIPYGIIWFFVGMGVCYHIHKDKTAE